jgi:hypothetical protein
VSRGGRRDRDTDVRYLDGSSPRGAEIPQEILASAVLHSEPVFRGSCDCWSPGQATPKLHYFLQALGLPLRPDIYSRPSRCSIIDCYSWNEAPQPSFNLSPTFRGSVLDSLLSFSAFLCFFISLFCSCAYVPTSKFRFLV